MHVALESRILKLLSCTTGNYMPYHFDTASSIPDDATVKGEKLVFSSLEGWNTLSPRSLNALLASHSHL